MLLLLMIQSVKIHEALIGIALEPRSNRRIFTDQIQLKNTDIEVSALLRE